MTIVIIRKVVPTLCQQKCQVRDQNVNFNGTLDTVKVLNRKYVYLMRLIINKKLT